jgi:hypothetical protein
MTHNIIAVLRSKPVGEQARLLGTLSSHVTDTNLVNLMSNYDLNNKKNDKTLQAQLNSFTDSATRAQVSKWLSQ